jgi:peptidoglycan/LPS O-acetylase OafA/YrhL
MEEQFYLFWPAIETFGSALGQVLLLGTLLALCQASNFGLTDHLIDRVYGLQEAHSRPLFQCTFTPIVFGVILAHLLHAPKTFEAVANSFQWPVLIPCLLTVIVVAAELSGGNIQGLPRLVIHLGMTLLLGAIVLNPGNLITRFLQIRPLAFVGRISYGVYLYHPIILALVLGAMHAVHPEKPSVFELMLVVLPVALLSAAISYRWIEAPLLKLRKQAA